MYLDLIDDMRRTGDADLALSSLVDLSLRMHWSNPSDALRHRYVEIAEALDTPGDDYRALVAIATAAPIERGAASLERLERLRDRVDLDATALCELGNAASSVGAFPLSNRVLTPCIADLRAPGVAAVRSSGPGTPSWRRPGSIRGNGPLHGDVGAAGRAL